MIDKEGMSVPHSIFWAMMDFVEFRQEGVVWGLIDWPPDGGTEIRLNATGQYALVDDGQIEFVGSCRHQDPCTGTYTLAFSAKNGLQIVSKDTTLSLERVGPPSETPPLAVEGPSPSPTPAATK